MCAAAAGSGASGRRMADHLAHSASRDQFGAVEGADGISVVRGRGITRGWNGIQHRAPALESSVENQAGDFIFIEPGVPKEVFNLSDTEPVVAIVARSDASEWEHIIPFTRPAASGEVA